MSKVVVLGAGGGIGSIAARTLSVLGKEHEIVLADVRVEAAEALARELGGGDITGRGFDARDARSLASIMEGADVVLNCVGPFYEFGPPILRAAIAAKVAYVDVCDDLAPTRIMLDLDEEAKAAGVRALIGMGNSPGLANVLVKLCGDMLLDEVHEVDIMHIHGGEAEEGAAVIKHRIHAMLNPVPLYIDGEMISVRQLEESGAAYTVQTEFRGIGEFPVYPYPHPETITLPMHIPSLRRATNLGVIFPLSYFHLTQDMVRVGACGEEPITVEGQEVTPIEFSVAHIQSRRSQMLEEAGIEGPGGCLKVVVSGEKSGERNTYIFSLSSNTAGAGEGTGIPAAIGVMLMLQGKVERLGVFPPEAGVKPFDVLAMASVATKGLGMGGAESVHVRRIDAAGNESDVPLPF